MLIVEKEPEKLDAWEFYNQCVGIERLYFSIGIIAAVVCTISACTGQGIVAGITYMITIIMILVWDKSTKNRIKKEQRKILEQYKQNKL